jgi:septin family protein
LTESRAFIEVHKQTIELEQGSIPVRLTVCDTPGFGNSIDNESAFSAISDYLEKQYDDLLAEESRIKRNARLEDSRVHALLYFITPTGHRSAQFTCHQYPIAFLHSLHSLFWLAHHQLERNGH